MFTGHNGIRRHRGQDLSLLSSSQQTAACLRKEKKNEINAYWLTNAISTRCLNWVNRRRRVEWQYRLCRCKSIDATNVSVNEPFQSLLIDWLHAWRHKWEAQKQLLTLINARLNGSILFVERHHALLFVWSTDVEFIVHWRGLHFHSHQRHSFVRRWQSDLLEFHRESHVNW